MNNHMKLLCSICRKGDGMAKEDTFGSTGNFAWVIDGATDVFGRNTFGVENEVAWYADHLTEKIKQNCTEEKNPEEILLQAVKQMEEEYSLSKYRNVPEYVMPTFAISFIKAEQDKIRYLILGDCCICTLEKNLPEIRTDQRLKKFSDYNRLKLKKYIDVHHAPPVSKEIYQEVRSHANASDGYPIGSVYGTGIRNAMQGEIRVKENERILLFSDGMLDYASSCPERIRYFFEPDTFYSEVDHMDVFLNNDKQFQKSPRPKKMDDCTILLLEV